MSGIANLEEYESKLLNCPKAQSLSTCEKVADSYGNDLLEIDDFPDDYFDFFLRLLSERQFFSKPGIWHFLLVVGIESDNLSTEMYKKISDCFIANYAEYQDEMLCLTVCDFVAWNFEDAKAEKLLLKLRNLEQGKAEKGFANDGLRTLYINRMQAKNEKKG